jgi:hypothetical protein
MKLSLLEWILCAALLVVGITAGLQAWRLHGLNEKVVKQASALTTYHEAQTTNLATIGTLKKANTAWSSACRLDPQAQAAAVAALNAQIAALEDQLVEAHRSREVIYVRDPKARAWGDAAVPAAIADQLFPAKAH